jgi:hypothetical protein
MSESGGLSLLQDETFSGFFWSLSSEDKDTRIQAASSLLEYLVAKQQQEDSGLNGKAKHQPSTHLTYTVNRLLKGLRGRDSAREGFAIALIEVPMITWLLTNCT